MVFLLLILLSSLGSSQGVAYVYDHLYNMIDSVGFARTVPQINTNTPATVTLALAIHRVFRMDAQNQELVADGVLSMRWGDFRLAWEPWVASNMDAIVWPKADSLWTPDILVLNGFGSEFDISPEASSVRIDNRGNVTWSRRLRMRVPCDVTVSDYASDVTCEISFSSWSHDRGSLSLVASRDEVDVSEYWADSPYVIRGSGVTRATRTSDCCPGSFDVIKYSVVVSY